MENPNPENRIFSTDFVLQTLRKASWHHRLRQMQSLQRLLLSLLGTGRRRAPKITRNQYNVHIFSRIRLYAAGKGDLTDRKDQKAQGLSEAQEIELAKQGDGEAFEFLYNLHKRRVYSLCLRMTANTAEAEDLTQEAFLQLFRKIATFRGESAFSTWLHRIAVNVVLVHLREKGLWVVSLEDPAEGD